MRKLQIIILSEIYQHIAATYIFIFIFVKALLLFMSFYFYTWCIPDYATTSRETEI